MPSKLHHNLLVEAINDYLERGYRLLMLNRNLMKDYRPDAVVENDEEIVVIEVVVTSDRVPRVEDLQTLFPKTLRIDKRGCCLKRITISISDEIQEWIEENIGKKRFHNYQRAVEYCLYQEMARNREQEGKP